MHIKFAKIKIVKELIVEHVRQNSFCGMQDCRFLFLAPIFRKEEIRLKAKTKKIKEIRCPYCGAKAKLMTSREMFGEEAFDPERKLYVCQNYEKGCDSYVYTQKGTNIPLGQMADSALRAMRIKAHKAINDVVRSRKMSKNDVYKYIAAAMGYREGHFHLAQSSYYNCQETIRLMENLKSIKKEMVR